MKKLLLFNVLLVATLITAQAQTQYVNVLGAATGWYSDDTRNGYGNDLVGITKTLYGKPGQTPTAQDDNMIAQQISFSGGPNNVGALKMDKTSVSGGYSKCTISKVDLSGFAIDDSWLNSFFCTYRYYTNSSAEVTVPKIGIQSTAWVTSQTGFTAQRSGESVWDLILVDWRGTDPGWTVGSWDIFTTDKNTVCWRIYRQAGNNYLPPPPNVKMSLQQIKEDSTWGPLIFGTGAKVTSFQLGVGSSNQTSTSYIDYVETNLLNGGNRVDFVTPVHNITQGTYFGTIQAGINDATTINGDIIEVAAGIYNENVDINKSVTLLGNTGAVLKGTGSGIGFQVHSPNITINGFEIKNYQIGIRTFGGPGNYGDLNILNCNIHNNTENGILFVYDIFNKVTIENTQVTDNNQNGIGIGNQATITNLEIINSNFSNNIWHGLFIAYSILNNVLIENSNFDGAKTNGFCGINFGTKESTIGSFTMIGGSVSGNKGGGFYVVQKPTVFNELVLNGVLVQNNTESGVMLGGGAKTGDLTVINCSFEENGWEDFDLSGGWFGAFSVLNIAAFQNNIFGLGPTWANLYIGSNGSISGIEIHENSFPVGKIGIDNNNATLVNATCNYWGDPSGPSGVGSGSGSVISTNIAFYPWWLTFPSNICGLAKEEKALAKVVLTPYLNDPDKKIKDAAKEAIKEIDKSLAPDLWLDANHLSDKGKKVFDKEKNVVKDLMNKLLKKYSGQVAIDAMAAINHLIEADKILAEVAISEVVCNGSSTCENYLSKALESMNKAEINYSAGKFDIAVEDYKKAWGFAIKAAGIALPKESADFAEVPTIFSLGRNYPNPFNPKTTISYQVMLPGNVEITIFNSLGQEVATLVNEFKDAGNFEVQWDASNLSSGIYFYKMTAGDFISIQKMILMK